MRPGPEDDRMPVWSPDGRRLAFVRDDDIWIVGADGSEPRRLTADQAANFDPDWSPTGDRIAFSSQRSGEVRIWTIAADGSDARGGTREIGGVESHTSSQMIMKVLCGERWCKLYLKRMESTTRAGHLTVPRSSSSVGEARKVLRTPISTSLRWRAAQCGPSYVHRASMGYLAGGGGGLPKDLIGSRCGAPRRP